MQVSSRGNSSRSLFVVVFVTRCRTFQSAGTQAMSNAQHYSSSHESSRLQRDGSMSTLASTFLPAIDHVS